MCEPGGGHGGWLPSISRRSIACIPRDGQGTAAPAAPPSPAQGAAARPAWRAGARGYAPSAAGASGTSPPLWAGAGCRSVPRKAPLYPRAPLGEEAAGGLRLFPASRQPLCLMPLLWKMSHPAVGKSVLALINKRLCPGVPVSPPPGTLPCWGAEPRLGAAKPPARGGRLRCPSGRPPSRQSGIAPLASAVSLPLR